MAAPLKSLDRHDRQVIFMGTFSKTIMPSLRMGYVVMPASTVGAFQHLRGHYHQRPAGADAKILTARFSTKGIFSVT